jgi:poly(3-hydroxybutyrate) depolymerase
MMTYFIAHRLSARIASIAPVAGLPLLGYLKQAVPTAPMAVMATNGLLDHVIPANISNGFMGRAGPAGSSWSSDGFYCAPRTPS